MSTNSVTPSEDKPLSKVVLRINFGSWMTDDAIKALTDPSVNSLDINRSRARAKTTTKKKDLEAELKKIATALEGPKCHVTTLNIFNKQNGKLGCEYLRDALISGNCKQLTTLGLISEKMNDGIEALCTALVHAECELT